MCGAVFHALPNDTVQSELLKYANRKAELICRNL